MRAFFCEGTAEEIIPVIRAFFDGPSNSSDQRPNRQVFSFGGVSWERQEEHHGVKTEPEQLQTEWRPEDQHHLPMGEGPLGMGASAPSPSTSLHLSRQEDVARALMMASPVPPSSHLSGMEHVERPSMVASAPLLAPLATSSHLSRQENVERASMVASVPTLASLSTSSHRLRQEDLGRAPMVASALSAAPLSASTHNSRQEHVERALRTRPYYRVSDTADGKGRKRIKVNANDNNCTRNTTRCQNCGMNTPTFSSFESHDCLGDAFRCPESGCTFNSKTQRGLAVHTTRIHCQYMAAPVVSLMPPAELMSPQAVLADGGKPKTNPEQLETIGRSGALALEGEEKGLAPFGELQENLYVCTRAGCGRTYRKDSLLIHMRLYHKDVADNGLQVQELPVKRTHGFSIEQDDFAPKKEKY